MRGPGPSPKPAPLDMFCLLATSVFALDRAMALRWWSALQGSHQPTAKRVSRQFARYRGNVNNFAWWLWHEGPTAKHLVEATECLVAEASLTRQEASAIEEGVLRATRPDGAWK